MDIVAPFAGAWIEIKFLGRQLMLRWSHPSRVRGLKLAACGQKSAEDMSHPSRVRGLKYYRKGSLSLFLVSHPSRVRGLKLVNQL